MSRLVNTPITVSLGPDGSGNLKPIGFVYRGGRYRIVEVLETFEVSKPWWLDPNYTQHGPQQEKTWRVRLADGGVVELVQDGTAWTLYRSYD